MSLSRVAEVKSDPSAACVELLESLLAEAKAGQLTMLAIASVDEKGQGMHSFAWEGSNDRLQLLGAVERMKHGLLRKIDP
jgi:hypothetical protein